MRDLALSLVIICVLGCGAARPATNLGGGASQTGCPNVLACNEGGGQGTLLLPAALVGAGVVGVALFVYVYDLVRPPPRATVPVPP